jgi:hypothetical protein
VSGWAQYHDEDEADRMAEDDRLEREAHERDEADREAEKGPALRGRGLLARHLKGTVQDDG